MTQEIMSQKKSLLSGKELLKCLPHRYPFLLVDKVVEVEYNKRIVAIKNVTFNEPQFMGHFPGEPIMPGVLIIEAMAQAGALMITANPDFDSSGKLVYFMSIDNAKFRQLVVPGDTMELHIRVIQNRANVWRLSAEAIVAGNKVAEAELKAMIVDKVEK